MDKIKYSNFLNNDEAVLATKCLDYYDGNQLKWMVKFLSDPNTGHRNWASRGFIPRFRNILKMVVDKSSLLFSDKLPHFELFPMNSLEEDERAESIYTEILDSTNWQHVISTLDISVRLLKTCILLILYDPEIGFVFEILHRGNSAVITDPRTNKISTLIYRTRIDEDENTQEFKVWTEFEVKTVLVNKANEEFITTEANPYGIIPAVVFHDVNLPRTGFWNKIPNDLIQINEMYNIHLIDSEYALRWSKLPTLFTNARIATSTDDTSHVVEEVYNRPLPMVKYTTENALIGGPNKVVTIDTTQCDGNIILEYKTPEVNIEPIDRVFGEWVRDFASDWSVNIKSSKSAVAESGFKLIVEEMDNLELRKRRQKMFEISFSQLFDTIKNIVNIIAPGTFNDDLKCYTTFAKPSLPINEKENEDIWTTKINEGRASRIDYFVENFGMTREEAMEKIIEIDGNRNKNEKIINSKSDLD